MVKYKINKKMLMIGAKHELEHTKDMNEAKKIASDHLEEHPTYYKILPYAERIMARDERNIKPIRRKKRKPPANIINMKYNF